MNRYTSHAAHNNPFPTKKQAATKHSRSKLRHVRSSQHEFAELLKNQRLSAIEGVHQRNRFKLLIDILTVLLYKPTDGVVSQ